jgi:hypothetical protein
MLSKSGLKTTPSLFKPTFVTDGLFEKAFAGDYDAMRKMSLTNFAPGILLARQTVDYTTNPNLQDTVSAAMGLEISAVSTHEMRAVSSISLRSVGAGFSREEAKSAAEERLLQQLAGGALSKINQALSEQ